jgi:hypothetical protein
MCWNCLESLLTLYVGRVFVELVFLTAENDKGETFKQLRPLLILLLSRGEQAQRVALTRGNSD